MQLNTLLEKAGSSSITRYFLNLILRRTIPFNAPHKFCITTIKPGELTITLPYIRINKNHVNGIHACALATLCEYITGLSIIRELPPDKFRIILKDIQMIYHYQAKMEVFTRFSLPNDEINFISSKLKTEDAVLRWYEVDVYDVSNNHICTGKIHWQIKPWDKTRTGKVKSE